MPEVSSCTPGGEFGMRFHRPEGSHREEPEGSHREVGSTLCAGGRSNLSAVADSPESGEVDDVGDDVEFESGPPQVARLILRLILLTVAFWLVASGYLLFSAQRHAREGERALREVTDVFDEQEIGEIDFRAVEAKVLHGERELAEAKDSMQSLPVRMLSPFPVVGRQLDSVRALLWTSHDVARALVPLVSSARSAQDDPGSLDRVGFLRETSAQLEVLGQLAVDADLGPSENLIGPLRNGRLDLREELDGLALDTAEYRLITDGLASFLDGSRYVLLGANNAEMRIASGMHLSVGELTLSDGDFDLPGLEPTASLFPVRGARVVDEDIQNQWGFLLPSNDYRKLAYSARFSEYTGPQAVELWRAQTGEVLDGAIALDPFVLDALLSVVGEVTIDGRTFASGDALLYLLQDQYGEFDPDQRDERRDRLSELAKAVVERFDESGWDPLKLLSALRPLVSGRHILVYSNDPIEQAAWDGLGVSGQLEGDETGVFLMNVGVNKLDPFMSISVDMTVADVDDQASDESGPQKSVTYEVTIRNQAPRRGLPAYVVGPWEELELEAEGTYRGRLAIYVPGFTTFAQFDSDHPLAAFGSDGPVVIAATQPFVIPPGGREELRFVFRVPGEVNTLELVPSAHFPPIEWNIGEDYFDDSLAVPITLD